MVPCWQDAGSRCPVYVLSLLQLPPHVSSVDMTRFQRRASATTPATRTRPRLRSSPTTRKAHLYFARSRRIQPVLTRRSLPTCFPACQTSAMGVLCVERQGMDCSVPRSFNRAVFTLSVRISRPWSTNASVHMVLPERSPPQLFSLCYQMCHRVLPGIACSRLLTVHPPATEMVLLYVHPNPLYGETSSRDL